MRDYRRMERFAADAIKAERDHAIKSAIKANTPWADLTEMFGLSSAEIEKIIVASYPTHEKRGSAIIVRGDEPPSERRH